MNVRDFLVVARRLCAGPTEADWRSAVSRAYYAAFHVGRQLLRDCGFRVPLGDRAHAYVWLRLCNCGSKGVQKAGADLNYLRGLRNEADYDTDGVVEQATSATHVDLAETIIKTLDQAITEPTKTQITAAIRTYERTILREVTWQR